MTTMIMIVMMTASVTFLTVRTKWKEVISIILSPSVCRLSAVMFGSLYVFLHFIDSLHKDFPNYTNNYGLSVIDTSQLVSSLDNYPPFHFYLHAFGNNGSHYFIMKTSIFRHITSVVVFFKIVAIYSSNIKSRHQPWLKYLPTEH